MPKIKDTDYLFLSTRIKSMERNLLNGERLERMLEARTPEDAVKVLTECGWPDMPRVDLDELDRVLTQERDKTLKDLTSSAPHPEILEVFKVKYDYHNIKTLLKAEAMGTDAERLLVSAGRVKVEKLTEKLRSGDLRGLPGILQSAAGEAREVLGTTGDPQLADFVLDRACYADMADIASKSGSAFLAGYVRITVDAANLRSVVRTLRMGKGAEFLKGCLLYTSLVLGQALEVVHVHQHPGGDVHVSQLSGDLDGVLHAATGDSHLAAVLGGHRDDLLHPVHVGGEGGDDDPLLAAPEQGVKGGAHAPLALGEAGTLHVGGVGQQGQNALLAQLTQSGQVDHAAGHRGGVDLEVAGVDAHAHRALDGKAADVYKRQGLRLVFL